MQNNPKQSSEKDAVVLHPRISYSETLNNEYIGRIYQMSSWQSFNEFYTMLRKFQYLQTK